MVRVAAVSRWNRLHQLVLDGPWRRAGGEAGPVGDAEDVRVDGARLVAENLVQDDVRRLAADAGQRLERGAVVRDLAAVARDERGA